MLANRNRTGIANLQAPKTEIKERAKVRKVRRVADQLEDIAEHGPVLEEQGDLEASVEELKIGDEHDTAKNRNRKAPSDEMKEVLRRTATEARSKVSEENVSAGVEVTEATIKEALAIMSDAVKIVGIDLGDEVLSPQKDENHEIELSEAAMWFASKQMERKDILSEYLGKNEKTKVIVKLAKVGSGVPEREQAFTEEQKKVMMAAENQRKEEFRRIDKNEDDEQLNSNWSSDLLRRQFQGLQNVSWKPK